MENCDKNNSKIRRLVLRIASKPWSEEEKQALEELLCENIDTAVWNKSEDDIETEQTRKQIMDKFKKKFPANEHNDYDIMYKMGLIVCKIKSFIPKPIRVKSKKSRSIETRQIKPVQQATFQVIKKQIQFDNIIGRMENNYNDLFPQVNPQDTEITPKTTNSDEICSDYSFDYSNFENPFYNGDSNESYLQANPQANPQDTEITPKTTNSNEICLEYSLDCFEFENQFCDEDLYDYDNGNYL